MVVRMVHPLVIHRVHHKLMRRESQEIAECGEAMDGERWQRIREILEAALEHEAAERSAFLEEACGGDESLLEDLHGGRLLENTGALGRTPPGRSRGAGRGVPRHRDRATSTGKSPLGAETRPSSTGESLDRRPRRKSKTFSSRSRHPRGRR